ncbi:SIR2 family NAD-dependent protein deacylase [Methylovirgula sp. 4M-Z18]|uniref:SIR2 family NAD-dependent protein deacylase n=1 Tax=Methylovirgula sp. 4M-Z18 TaxID=2293567 RepID=UPI000E2E4614|nr:NAD-dependent deacylase [Methylovirgula sp. 4M-Z18]RFB81167.1 NAD-dependent deacylase [Methylovirgula sp. 4M-Z18]
MDTFDLHPDLVPAFHAILRKARRIVVFTGAGASAESGIPTFRDAQVGLWHRFRPQDLATPEGFLRDPALVYGWYEWRRAKVAAAEPNAGHRAIAAWAQTRDVTVITQNVDDLHERAGSSRVIHLHGSIFAARCFDCGAAYKLPPPSVDAAGTGEAMDPPRCAACNGLIRPGVVWFNENLPQREWAKAEELCRTADLLLCIGTSGLVYPAAGLPQVAAQAGAPIAQINPEATDLDALADFNIRGTAGKIMPRLVAAAMQG